MLGIKNGNSFWRDAIAKEMKNVRVAFEVLPEGSKPPPTFKELHCYIVFDVKMDLTRKARFVANGSKTADPDGSNYAGVVSRDSVRIEFTYATLHGLDLMAGDIQNAYLQAPTSEKFWCKCGKEFGSEEEGGIAVIACALYGTSHRDVIFATIYVTAWTIWAMSRVLVILTFGFVKLLKMMALNTTSICCYMLTIL